MKKTLAIAICTVLLVLSLSVTGLAKDYYVKPGATGKGTKDAPYGKLWKALGKALRGDVIHVAAGTFNGKGDSGNFTVKVPNLTLVGGYNADFSERDPFKNHTILERKKDYKGDWTGLKEGIIEGIEGKDHSGMIVDGFVLNSQSRNVYEKSGNIRPKGCWKGSILKASSPNIKIRNCILMNSYGNGIYCAWRGKENEISNCFILNTFYTAISTRSAQPDSVVKIKNNTVSFVWTQPSKGGGTSLIVGSQGQTIAENNIFMFNQAFAINNGFGNEDTILKNNIFFQCKGGYYKYKDDDGKNLLVWKPEELKEMDEDAEPYMLSECEGNTNKDPGLKPDKDYFEKFTNFVGSTPGKLKMDAINKWRRAMGLPLQGAAGSKRKNWGMIYPLKSVIPNLASKIKGVGAHAKSSGAVFVKYTSKAAGASKKNYVETEFDAFKKGAPEVKKLEGKPVQIKAALGAKTHTYLLKSAPRDKYICVKLMKPGEGDMTRNYIFGYILKGTEAEKKWNKYLKKKKKYNKKGIVIKGTAWYGGNDNYSYPAVIIIDEIKKK